MYVYYVRAFLYILNDDDNIDNKTTGWIELKSKTYMFPVVW